MFPFFLAYDIIFLFSVKKTPEKFGGFRFSRYLCTRFSARRAFSSVGLEHLPYKQRVGGSNPSTPTSMY